MNSDRETNCGITKDFDRLKPVESDYYRRCSAFCLFDHCSDELDHSIQIRHHSPASTINTDTELLWMLNFDSNPIVEILEAEIGKKLVLFNDFPNCSCIDRED